MSAARRRRWRRCASKGGGQLVYNADEFRWGGTYFRRISERYAPHNVYTDGKSLRKLANRVGAEDGPMEAGLEVRAGRAARRSAPSGGTIQVAYPANTIKYSYDRSINTYLPRRHPARRSRSTRRPASGSHPKNVVVMLMSLRAAQRRLRTSTGSRPRSSATARPGSRPTARRSSGTWRKKSPDRPDPLLRRGRQAGHPDGRPDLHPGHAARLDGHDQGRQGAAPVAAVPSAQPDRDRPPAESQPVAPRSGRRGRSAP